MVPVHPDRFSNCFLQVFLRFNRFLAIFVPLVVLDAFLLTSNVGGLRLDVNAMLFYRVDCLFILDSSLLWLLLRPGMNGRSFFFLLFQSALFLNIFVGF